MEREHSHDEEVYGYGKIVVTGITFLLPIPNFLYPGTDVYFHTIPLLKKRMFQHFLRARTVIGVLDQAICKLR
jgi:hypothetical protein